jgi:hypothetical protein
MAQVTDTPLAKLNYFSRRLFHITHHNLEHLHMKRSRKAVKALTQELSKLKLTKAQKDTFRSRIIAAQQESYFEGYLDGIDVSEKIIDRKITSGELANLTPRHDSRMILW